MYTTLLKFQNTKKLFVNYSFLKPNNALKFIEPKKKKKMENKNKKSDLAMLKEQKLKHD